MPRHAHVEHHGVGHPVGDLGEALLPALGRHHLVAAERERAPQRVAHRAVVVHHEDPHQVPL